MVQLDHHCPFVNNCVGRGNRRVFVFFTLFAGFGCVLVSVLSYYIQRQYLCPDFQGWVSVDILTCIIRSDRLSDGF